MERILIVTHSQGSWKYQVRGQRVRYTPKRLRDGRLVWCSTEVLDTKVNCGNIRDGGHAPDKSLHMVPLTAEEIAEYESQAGSSN